MSFNTAAQGWLNLALYSHDLTPLVNPRVVIEITEAMRTTITPFGGAAPAGAVIIDPAPGQREAARMAALGLSTASASDNNFGFQLNCNSPVGYLSEGNPFFTGYEQFVSEDYGFAIQNITFITPNSNLYADGYGGQESAFPSPVPAGWKFDIAILTDPVTRYTTGSLTNIYDQNGNLVSSSNLTVAGTLQGYPSGGAFQQAWNAPISALTLEIVGTGSTTAVYSSGAGKITYIPSGGQTYDVLAPAKYAGTGNPYYPFPAGLDIDSQNIHTSENSNQMYSNTAQEPDGSVIQYFSWNGTYPPPGSGVTSNSVVILVAG